MRDLTKFERKRRFREEEDRLKAKLSFLNKRSFIIFILGLVICAGVISRILPMFNQVRGKIEFYIEFEDPLVYDLFTLWNIGTYFQPIYSRHISVKYWVCEPVR